MSATAGLGYSAATAITKPCIAAQSDAGSVESLRYYLARRTVLEMLSDRGCDVADSELTRPLPEFRAEFGDKPDLEKLRVCVPLLSRPSKKVMVIFCGTDEIRKQDAVGILLQVTNKESLHRVILVLQNKINSFAQKVLDDFAVKVETFHIADLLVNITKHVLEPKHQILTSKEKELLLEKYNVEDKKIPRMMETDAIARYYGLEKRQVVKVTHKGPATNLLETYRCVM